MKKLIICMGLSLVIFALSPGIALSQSGIQVERNEVIQDFPVGISFNLEVGSAVRIEKVVLVYGTDGLTCQAGKAHQQMDIEPGTSVRVEWDWEWKRSGILPPGTMVWWQWEITDETGMIHQVPEQRITVQDGRHQWQHLSHNGVHLQWHTGDEKFGDDLLTIILDSLDQLEQDLGIRPSEDLYITVYPTSEEVQDALLVTTDWTGGVAFPDHNSMIIAVYPDDFEWAGVILPHELTHLVVDALIFNCHGVWLPTWLSEGLAENSEGAPTQEQIDLVIEALELGSLPNLGFLERGFSAYGDEANLSYSQSKLVVYYLIQEYGAEKMIETLEIMQAGNHVDQALTQVYGFDTCGLDAAWRTSLGFTPEVEPSCELSIADQASATPTPVPTFALVALDLPQTATLHPVSTITSPTPFVEPTYSPTLPAIRTPSAPLTPTSAQLQPDPLPKPEQDSAWIPALLASSIGGVLILLLILVLFIRRR